MKRLAIITTHPIQYNAPLYKLLTERGIIKIKVFYTWGDQVLQNKYDPGFKKTIEWDIPLLEGYDYQFVENISTCPGSNHYNGIINPTLIEEIKNWGPDSLLVYGWKFNSHLKCINYFHKKIPIYFRGDSTLLDKKNKVYLFIKKIILKPIYKKIDTFFYVGKANKEYFLKNGVQKNKLVFAPHAVDNKRFGDDEAKKNSKNELKITADDFVFLFAGKFENKKNPMLLLKTFIELPYKKAILLFVGNGELELKLKSFCLNLDKSIRDRIYFMNFQNQSKMPYIYQNVNAFVLPSQGPEETWGLSVNEAMASGIPVIVSDKCGCSYDIVKNYETGLIFKSNNEQGLLDSMNYMLSNMELTKEMGNNAKKLISHWSFENICKTIEETVSLCRI